MPKSSRRRLANPLLPGASPGARSISGPSSNSRTTQWHCVDRGAIPRGSTFFIGHEEDSNPRRSDRRDTRGSTEVPDHFKFRQSVGSDARRWYRRETGATPVGGSFCPVAQQLERPALTREVDGANPSGAAIFGSQSGRARRRRLEAGRSCNRSLWSMSTDFRFGSQALQRCSGLLNRGARGSTVATHQFQHGS